MVAPPPPHRRQRKRGPTKTKKPKLPPQPPRWTTKSHEVTNNNPLIQIDIFSDTRNLLTLAYTYTKPGIRQRHLVRIGTVRPHHDQFDFDDISFKNQSQGSPSLQHTFLIPSKEGCWTVYYAAFDTDSPQTAHSISPIFSLHYCATTPPTPNAFPYDSDDPLTAPAVGDWVIAEHGPDQTTPRAELEAPGQPKWDIYPPITLGVRVYANTPPYDYTHTELAWVAITLFKCVSVPFTPNRRCFGVVLSGRFLEENNPHWTIRYQPNFHYNAGLPPRWGGSFPVQAQPNQVSVFTQVGWSGAGGDVQIPTPPTVPFHLVFGQIAVNTTEGFCAPNTDGQFITGWVKFTPAPGIIYNLYDSSSFWRKLPAVQDGSE